MVNDLRSDEARWSVGTSNTTNPVAMISETERGRLVVLFRKEDSVDPLPLPPENMAALMINNTPAVARKWLEEECLLDSQIGDKKID